MFLEENGPFHDPRTALSGFRRTNVAELGAKDEPGVDWVLAEDRDAEGALEVTLSEAGRESALSGLRTNGEGFRGSGRRSGMERLRLLVEDEAEGGTEVEEDNERLEVEDACETDM